MKIYTRTGDGGDTGLFGGGRVPKDDPRVEAYGTVDELNSVLGWAITQLSDAELRASLQAIQHDLFALGSELATPPPQEGRRRPETPGLPEGRIQQMEGWIDRADAELQPLSEFVLPGGSPGAAALHVARTVCRRAERAVVRAAGSEVLPAMAIVYLNRLSDLLFSHARLENARLSTPDVTWRKP